MPASEPALMVGLECHAKKKVRGQKNRDLAQSFRSNDKVICYCKQSALCVPKLLEKAISAKPRWLFFAFSPRKGNLQ